MKTLLIVLGVFAFLWCLGMIQEIIETRKGRKR